MPPGPPALELVLLEPNNATSFALPASGQVTIGRGAGTDVRVEHSSISRRHAVLHLGASLFIEDLGSANGTFVSLHAAAGSGGTTTPDQARVSPGQRVAVSVGQGLRLGSRLLVVRPRARADAAAAEGRPSGVVPVVEDPAMRSLYALAEKVARSPLSVLILGETGVGKEVLAETIHRRSERAAASFLRLNCAALSESLLESELFGHEAGAFTGAVRAKPGLLETAAGGTVFLDEVGELPAGLQVKLLRVLEDRKVTRVGGLKPIRIDMRFIAATNRDLEAEVKAGRFRQDLYFRLNGVSLTVPPLRERKAEIRELVGLFVARTAQQLGRTRAPRVSNEALARLEGHDWPGNIRELRNVIERAVVLSGDELLSEEQLPAALGPPRAETAATMATTARARAAAPAAATPADLRGELEAIERKRILDALERCAGNQSEAARQLGMSRRTFVTRLEAYGAPRPRKRPGRAD